MKKFLHTIVFPFLVALLLVGCDMPYGKSTIHTFAYNREDVVKVDICANSDLEIWREGEVISSLTTIATVPEEEIDTIWQILPSFGAYEVNYLSGGCGDLVFVIHYTNGDRELIGFYEIGLLNEDGTFKGYRHHVLGVKVLLAQLFAQYADVTQLSEVSMSFKAYYESGPNE
jgi:hypothetical protein